MKMIYLEEQAELLAGLAECDYEVALSYLYAQDDFYDERGLNIYPEDPNYGEVVDSDIIIDDEEMLEFIKNKTYISSGMLHKLLEAKHKFLEDFGLENEVGANDEIY